MRSHMDMTQKEENTLNRPSCFTMLADTNVAAIPMKADNPLKPPIIDGFKPETF